MTDSPSSLQRALIDLAHTDDFDLLTFEHRNVLTNEITNRSKNAYFQAWEQDRSSIPIKTCNHVADVALSNLATGDDPLSACVRAGSSVNYNPVRDQHLRTIPAVRRCRERTPLFRGHALAQWGGLPRLRRS